MSENLVSNVVLTIFLTANLTFVNANENYIPLIDSKRTKGEAKQNELVNASNLKTLLDLAYKKVKTEEHKEAFKLLNKAQILVAESTSNELLIEYYFLSGLYFYYIHQSDSALLNFSKALAKSAEHNGVDHSTSARCEHWLANVYAHQFYQYAVAEPYYLRALRTLKRHTNDLKSECADLHYDMARYYQNRSQLETSLYHLELAENFYNSSGFLKESTDCQNLRAIDKLFRGQPTEAIKFEKQAIQSANHISNKRIKTKLVGKYYDNLGTIYLLLGKQDSAAFFYRMGRKVNSSIPDNDLQLSSSLINLGSLLTSTKPDSAIELLSRSVLLTEKLFGHKHFETSSAYFHIGEYYLKLTDYDSALNFFQRSLISLVPTFNNTSIYESPSQVPLAFASSFFWTLARKAETLCLKAFSSNNDSTLLKHSLSIVVAADSLIDLSLRNLQADDSKFLLKENLVSLYEVGIRSSLKLYELTANKDYLEFYFRFIENSKSNVLLNDLISLTNLDDSTRTIKYTISLHNLELYLAEKNGDIERIKRAEENLVRWREKFANNHQRMITNAHFITRSSLQDVKDYTRRNKSTVIEYYWGNENLYIISIAGDNTQTRVVPLDIELQKSIAEYHSLVSSPINLDTAYQQFQRFNTISERLYKILIQDLVETNNLIIISDGGLRNVPFETLISESSSAPAIAYKDLSYLVRSHAIQYQYSFSILNHLSSLRGDLMNNDILLVSPLSGMNTIPSSFRLTKLKNSNASKDDFLRLAPNYSIIHFAAHGYIDEENFINSYITLNDALEEHTLRLPEIFQLKINANLVILSTCESSLGKSITGEGFYSITRAFISAGCLAVISSLWKIPDQFTTTVTNNFWNSFTDDNSVNALQQSKLDYLKDADQVNAHPYYWGGLIHSGISVNAENSKNRRLALIGIGSVLIILIILILRKKLVRTMS